MQKHAAVGNRHVLRVGTELSCCTVFAIWSSPNAIYACLMNILVSGCLNTVLTSMALLFSISVFIQGVCPCCTKQALIPNAKAEQ